MHAAQTVHTQSLSDFPLFSLSLCFSPSCSLSSIGSFVHSRSLSSSLPHTLSLTHNHPRPHPRPHTYSHTQEADETLPEGIRLEHLAAEDMFPRFSKESRFSSILAVDSVYHMDKHAFLLHTARLFPLLL